MQNFFNDRWKRTVACENAQCTILVDMKIVSRNWKYEIAHVKKQIPCVVMFCWCHVTKSQSLDTNVGTSRVKLDMSCVHISLCEKSQSLEKTSCSHVTHFSHNEILATSTRTCENLWFTSKEARFMWSNAPCFITTCKNSDPQPITYKLHAWKCKFHLKFKLNIKISHWNYDFMCEKANFTWEDSQAHCVFLLI